MLWWSSCIAWCVCVFSIGLGCKHGIRALYFCHSTVISAISSVPRIFFTFYIFRSRKRDFRVDNLNCVSLFDYLIIILSYL